MGDALGSIMASVMAPHIRATIAKPLAPHVPCGMASDWHKASNALMPENSRPSASHPRPASAITQTAASTFGRAKAAPSRPAAGGRWERSCSVASLIASLHSASAQTGVPDARGVVSAPALRMLID